MRNFSSIQLGNKAKIFAVMLVALCVVAGSVFATISAVHAGLGYSPGSINIEGMSPNTSVTREVTFSREDIDKDLTLGVTFVGMGAEFLSGADEVKFVVGQDRAVYKFIVSVGSVPTGNYESQIFAITKEAGKTGSSGSSEQATAQSSVILAAYPKVTFSVTNEIRQKYTINNINIQPSEEQQPLGFTFQLENTGNVDARPDHVDITIVNQDIPSLIYAESISGESLSLVKAFETNDVSVFTKAVLVAGKYWVDFIFYDEKGIVFEQRQTSLQVFPPGTL